MTSLDLRHPSVRSILSCRLIVSKSESLFISFIPKKSLQTVILIKNVSENWSTLNRVSSTVLIGFFYCMSSKNANKSVKTFFLMLNIAVGSNKGLQIVRSSNNFDKIVRLIEQFRTIFKNSEISMGAIDICWKNNQFLN